MLKSETVSRLALDIASSLSCETFSRIDTEQLVLCIADMIEKQIDRDERPIRIIDRICDTADWKGRVLSGLVDLPDLLYLVSASLDWTVRSIPGSFLLCPGLDLDPIEIKIGDLEKAEKACLDVLCTDPGDRLQDLLHDRLSSLLA